MSEEFYWTIVRGMEYIDCAMNRLQRHTIQGSVLLSVHSIILAVHPHSCYQYTLLQYVSSTPIVALLLSSIPVLTYGVHLLTLDLSIVPLLRSHFWG